MLHVVAIDHFFVFFRPILDEIVMLKRSLSNPDVISYLKWSARSGDGVIIGYKTYQLRCIVRCNNMGA